MPTLRWPSSLDQIKTEFGDPAHFVVGDGLRVRDAWPETILCRLPLPQSLLLWDGSRANSISCHSLVASSLGTILAQINDAGMWTNLAPYGGCYCWRPQRAASKLSTHCWGIAVDFRIDSCELGTPGDMPASMVDLFEAEGWTWGGRWVRPDPQHFQAASGW
jgi:hypothetical protein